MDMVY